MSPYSLVFRIKWETLAEGIGWDIWNIEGIRETGMEGTACGDTWFLLPTKNEGEQERRMRWEGYVARMGREGTHTGFWWWSLKEGLLGSHRLRWDHNIKMELKETEGEGLDWRQGRLTEYCENGDELSVSRRMWVNYWRVKEQAAFKEKLLPPTVSWLVMLRSDSVCL